MTTLKVQLPTYDTRAELGQWIERVDGLVCVDGSRLMQVSLREAELTYRDDVDNLTRTDLNPAEVATFVRNFLDEGFDSKIVIA